MLNLLALLLGCSGDGVEPSTTQREPESCEQQPCVAVLASSIATGPEIDTSDWGGLPQPSPSPNFGEGLLGAAGSLFVLEPGNIKIHRLSPFDLSPLGVWGTGYPAGAILDATDIDGDGTIELALEREGPGEAYVQIIDGAFEGDLEPDAPALSTIAEEGFHLGYGLSFSADGSEIAVTGNAEVSAGSTGGHVLAFPTSARGSLNETQASRTITASEGSIDKLLYWDGDEDQLEDLVVTTAGTLYFFASGWSNRTLDDCDAQWTLDSENLIDLGDVTGNGASDLGLADPFWDGASVDSGRGLVLPSIGGGGDESDVPLRFEGDGGSRWFGWSMTGGDIDGDGQSDLALGAPDFDAHSMLLIYRGPLLGGVLTRSDADGIVYSEYPGDALGSAIVALDADGDERDAIAVSAPQWPHGGLSGAVYLLSGAALLP